MKIMEFKTFKRIAFVSYSSFLNNFNSTSKVIHGFNGIREKNSLKFEDVYGVDKEITKLLENMDFSEYSFALILIISNPPVSPSETEEDLQQLKKIVLAMKNNKTLNRVTKILFSPFFNESLQILFREHVIENERAKLANFFTSCENLIFTFDDTVDDSFFRKLNFQRLPESNNTFSFQENFRKIFYDLSFKMKTPIEEQESLMNCEERSVENMEFSKKTDWHLNLGGNVDFSQSHHSNYIFTLDPSISICFQHFTSKRIGNEKDLEYLKSTFNKLKIPQFIVSDGSFEDINAVMRKIEDMDLSVLKYLFIIISSHGKEDDIISTRNGEYNVFEHIIKPLKQNPTLKNTDIYVLVNACRGDFDYRMATEDETPPKVEKTDTSNWDENIVLCFSTQKGYVSYRSKGGTFFLQKFFNKLNEVVGSTCSIKNFAKEVENEIEKELKRFRVNQKPELLYNEKKEHSFEDLLQNLYKYEKTLDELANFVKEQMEVKN